MCRNSIVGISKTYQERRHHILDRGSPHEQIAPIDGGALVNEGDSHDTSGKVDGIGRPLRSWLFTPASRPDRFGKAAEVGADVLVLDLEDAVAPADKDQARATAIGYLGRPSSGGVLRARGIHGLDSRAGRSEEHT